MLFISSSSSSSSFFSLLRSLEYDSREHQQVGRWKVSHHMLQRAFANVFASCTREGLCILRNDGANAVEAVSVVIDVVHFATGALTTVHTGKYNCMNDEETETDRKKE